MENLFDSIKRAYDGPANHNENTYDFYDRSARKDIAVIRELLNLWFQNIPANERIELKSRFKNNFYSSFFELFLFQLFSKLGFQIEIHPTVTNSTKKPDFLIIKDDLEIYIEAKVVSGKSHEQEAFERMKNRFFDDFNKLDSKSFLINISKLNIKNKKQPSTKEIINSIQTEINRLDPSKVIKEVEEFGYSKIPTIELNDSDFHIIVELIPLISSSTNIKRKPIGKFPTEILLGGGEESLKDSISKKAKRYGLLDKPFLVCLNSLDIRTSDKIDIDNAIWGSLTWSKSSNNNDEKWGRQKDGVFINNKGPRLKNLSGVFITKVFPHNIPNTKYWLYEHPFSENKLNFSKIGLEFIYTKEGKIHDSTGQNFNKILEIPKDWLQN